MAPAESEESMKNRKCCICGDKISGFGRNPWPVVKKEGAECCDFCDSNVVLRARIMEILKSERKSKYGK